MSRNTPQSPFYGAAYARFADQLSAEIRCEVYGQDLGQQGWRSLDEQAALPQSLVLGPGVLLLDIACGSGGPALDLVKRSDCALVGIDLEETAIEVANRSVAEHPGRAAIQFLVMDCSRPLSFADSSFEAICCIDAIAHLPRRAAIIADWARLLRPGGRLYFADASVITGEVSHEEIYLRGSQGPFACVPPGVNENAIESAGLILNRTQNHTAEMADIASRWISARSKRAADLQTVEGDEFFGRRQRFLALVADLALSGRMSRFSYLAEKLS
jgi:SAM-dependent methyltransferase